jgi:adenosylmethionine-8-amino-7-oxononanoate aminotransferase
MMAHRRIYEAIVGGSGFFQHGHTYLGHAIACAAALEVQKVIAEENLLPKVRRLGERLQDRLQQRLGQHPHVGDIRGRGLFRGIELVADRDSKEPLDPSLRTHARLKAEAMRRGLLIYPMGGTIDGVRGDHVLLAPPFICTEAEIDEIAGRLGEAIDAILPAH